jgi:hypothetical protein
MTATEVLPSPLAVDAVVFVDSERRILTVRLPDQVGGYERQLWVQSWQRLRRAWEDGWPIIGPKPVPADLPGAADAVYGQPGDGAALVFSVPPKTDGFARLVSKPGVRALVVLDRVACEFSRVKFLNLPGGR